MKRKYLLLLLLFLFIFVSNIYSYNILNIYRHPEIAEKNSIFIDIGINLDFDALDKWDIKFQPIEFRIDYMIPFPLPIFFGIFMKTPNPNLNSFGYRVGYHFDLNNPSTDFYFFYTYDFGYLRNDLLIEYNDEPVEKFLYDFRFGIRKFFGRNALVGLCLETGFQLKSIVILISVKVN